MDGKASVFGGVGCEIFAEAIDHHIQKPCREGEGNPLCFSAKHTEKPRSIILHMDLLKFLFSLAGLIGDADPAHPIHPIVADGAAAVIISDQIIELILLY